MARILLIEDDRHSSVIMSRVLERAGHEVIAAYEGITGVRLLHTAPIDLILLDQGLPDLGGQAISALIRRVPDHPHIVAISASNDISVSQRALADGCVGFIQKPIDTRTFHQQVEVYLPAVTQQTHPTLSDKNAPDRDALDLPPRISPVL
jgi:CheY-like chemotaxis protein